MATIQGIYVALFERPADPLGLAYFNEETQNGQDLSVIGDLAGTAEYQDRFLGLTSEQIIDSIYVSLFNRSAEPDGIAFWAQRLDDGSLTINNIAIAILDGAAGTDAITVQNKITAANLFTSHLDQQVEIDSYRGAFAMEAGHDFLDGITADPSTIPDAEVTDLQILFLQRDPPAAMDASAEDNSSSEVSVVGSHTPDAHLS